jgi:hypothetical protein
MPTTKVPLGNELALRTPRTFKIRLGVIISFS